MRNVGIAIGIAIVVIVIGLLSYDPAKDPANIARAKLVHTEMKCDEARKAFMSAPRDKMNYQQSKRIDELDSDVRRFCGY